MADAKDFNAEHARATSDKSLDDIRKSTYAECMKSIKHASENGSYYATCWPLWDADLKRLRNMGYNVDPQRQKYYQDTAGAYLATVKWGKPSSKKESDDSSFRWAWSRQTTSH